MIQRKTVGSDPAADVHSDCGHLFPIYPDAGTAVHAAGLDREFGQRADDDLLDRADVSDHVSLPFSQIENRIADDLAGTVVGDVAAAVGRVKGDASAAEDFL